MTNKAGQCEGNPRQEKSTAIKLQNVEHELTMARKRRPNQEQEQKQEQELWQ